MDGKGLIGYYIGDSVLVDIPRQRLIGLSDEKNVVVLPLRITMMRLLRYMLEVSQGSIIMNDDIMLNVWDMHQLSSSSQRLWQVMRELKNKLSVLGIPDEFIIRVESRGYYLNSSMVTVLCKRNNAAGEMP